MEMFLPSRAELVKQTSDALGIVQDLKPSASF